MEPEKQNNIDNETGEDPQQEVVHPWHSSQDEPVVHTEIVPQDPAPEEVAPEPSSKKPPGGNLKRIFKSRKFWLACVGMVMLIGIILWFIQPARWWLVNLVGARNTLTITTISPGEGSKARVSQLNSVTVVVNGQTYRTDNTGRLQVPNVPYGQVSITASKTGYQSIDYGVALDFDPFLHKFGGQAQDDAARSIELSLTSTGIPVAFKVIDSLSGKPVTVGTFAIGDVVAKPDDQGQVSLKIPGTNASNATVSTNFGGQYVDKTFTVTLGAQNQHVTVVPGGKHYFVSNKDGALTVYSCNLDGSGVDSVVVGTGQETSAIAFAVSPDGKYGVLSSSRDGARNTRSDVLQRVYTVNLSTKQITRVDEAVSVTFADWSNDTLVYTTSSYDPTNNDYPTTLRSVDASTGRVYNFETADSISVSTVAFDKVAYQEYFHSGPNVSISPILREAPVDATLIQTLGQQTDYSSYLQLDFDRIAFKTAQDQAWHQYNFNTNELTTIVQPSSSSPQRFLSSSNGDGSERLLINLINGKNTLVLRDSATGTTHQLYGVEGLGGPIRWVGNVVVFRVTTNQETADYAVSLAGGDAHKIIDVTATAESLDPVTNQQFNFY